VCVLIRIVTKILQKMAFQTKPSAEVLQNSVNWMCGEDVVGVKIHKVYSTLITGEIKKNILLMKVTAATDSPGSND